MAYLGEGDFKRIESTGTTSTNVDDPDPEDYDLLNITDFDLEFLDDQDYKECSGNEVAVKKIPFSSIHESPSDGDRRFFLPGQKIHVKVVDCEVPDRSRAINPYVYVIELQHGEYQWTIRRRWKHFRHLHEQLMLFKAKVNIMPTRENHQRRKSFAARKQELPTFPKRPDRLVDDLEKRRNHLEQYLTNVLRSPQFRNHPETLKFLEVSPLSFVHQLGDKWREGLVKKRSGGTKATGCCGCGQLTKCNDWKVRWLILKDSFIGYIDPDTGMVRYVVLMDQEFKVELHKKAGMLSALRIANLSRELDLWSWTGRKAREWKEAIELAAATTGKDFIQTNRFESFVPDREDVPARWFVDAASYMAEVAEALELAREEIFITDWWLSPEVYLKRPYPECEQWRLDLVLKRKADAGVKIFVLVWKEMPMAVGINSLYTKQALLKLHSENIKVLRDPDGLVNLWSHHEKMVVVDQKIAFIGGIDLCYGRWDTPLHRLTDLGVDSVTSPTEEEKAPKFPTPSNGYINHRNNSSTTFETEHSEIHVGQGDAKENIDEVDIPKFKKDKAGVKSLREPARQYSLESAPTGSETSLKSSMSSIDKNRSKTVHGSDPPNLNPSADVGNYIRSVSVPSDFRPRIKSDGSAHRKISNQSGTIETIVEVNEERNGHEDESSVFANPLKQNSEYDEGLHNDSFEMDPDDLKSSSEDFHSVHSDISKMSSTKYNSNDSLQKQSHTDIRNILHAAAIKRSKNSKLACDKSRNSSSLNVSDGSLNSSKRSIERKQIPVHVPDIEICVTDLGGYSPDQTDKSVEDSFAIDNPMYVREQSKNKKESKANELLHVKQDLVACTRGEPKSFRDFLLSIASEGNHSFNESKETLMKDIKRLDDHPVKTISTREVEEQHKKMVIEAMKKTKQKKPSVLHLQSVLQGQGSVDMSTHGKISQAGSREVIPEKPSTPKAKGKFALKAQEVRMEMRDKLKVRNDIKSTFKSNRSKSLDVNKGNHIDPKAQFRDILFNEKPNPDTLMLTPQYSASKFWIGKDYTNFIFKDFVDLDQPFTDFIDRGVTPRMPWHDIGAVVYGKAARDVARHFIQRWNFTKNKKVKKNDRYPVLIPKTYSQVFIPPYVYTDRNTVLCNVQVLRSSSKWSTGVTKTECSIYNAYMDCIEKSQHYIYIENQFFISIENSPLVENNIAGALYRRIIRAHKNSETFRVYVLLPLLPAFEGELGTSTGTSIQAVTHWNYSSICRGPNSLLGRLALTVMDPFKYISFYCLRNHGEILGNLKTELVYIHSKLMIVDDLKVIIGSANINDRSMRGDRDSEIAVLIEDDREDSTNTIMSKMDGKRYRAGRFAYTLRTSLFREHLGLMDPNSNTLQAEDVTDPVCSHFYKDVWMRQASVNTSVYEKVFNCIPTELTRTFSELMDMQRRSTMALTDPERAREELKKVCGHLVLFPLHFLSEENLAPSAFSKENLAPTVVWT